MKKCLIWGANKEYNARINLLNYEILKHNIIPVAICSRDKYSNYINSLKVIDKSELPDYAFDYIIVFNDTRFEEIKKDIVSLGYNPNSVINSKTFEIPNFDFKRYSKIIENPITIISDDCFGALIYNHLNLPFNSPFILFQIPKDYLKFLNDFDYYINQPFKLLRETNVYESITPIASLGEGERQIEIQCFHYNSFKQAKEAWEKRISRINYDNLFVKMTLTDISQVSCFERIPFKNKVGFFYKPVESESVFYLPRYTWRILNKADVYGYDLAAYVRDTEYFTHSCDILKMLCNERDFILEQ